MDFPVSSITRPIISKLVALQSFFFARPRIDIDLRNDPEGPYGQKSLGLSQKQVMEEPIYVTEAVYDFEFYWNYKLRIKNNSSKTAYNLKIERIVKFPSDYLEKMDELVSLKENEMIELNYKLRHEDSMNGGQARQFLRSFPGHIDQIEIIISYTNEARKRYYTRFISTNSSKSSKSNEHLIRKPRTL